MTHATDLPRLGHHAYGRGLPRPDRQEPRNPPPPPTSTGAGPGRSRRGAGSTRPAPGKVEARHRPSSNPAPQGPSAPAALRRPDGPSSPRHRKRSAHRRAFMILVTAARQGWCARRSTAPRCAPARACPARERGEGGGAQARTMPRAYLRRQRPDPAEKLVRAEDHRPGEWMVAKPLLALYGLCTLRGLDADERRTSP